MMRRIGVLLVVLVLALAVGQAAAEEIAAELTAQCNFESNSKSHEFTLMTDGQVGTYFPYQESKGWLTVKADSPIAGVSVQLFDKFGRPLQFELQVPGEGDSWVTVAQGGAHLSTWFPLPEPAERIRILDTGRERLRIAELRVFGPGSKPADVQDWQDLGKCDLMLLTAHPDDEMLWFGGLLPTYAGERKLRVQNVLLVPTGGERKLELLGALWHCGVTAYPEFLGLLDKNGEFLSRQYKLWRGEDRVLSLVGAAVRKHQPEVLVTHGARGEYGHGAHQVAADAAMKVYRQAAMENRFPQSMAAYGPWQIKKLYLHDAKAHPITCDWDVPLTAFGGKTGYEVAEEAFAFHASQVKRDWKFERHGRYDNAVFDLRLTQVGKDSGIGDLMEHIDLGAAV